MMFSPPLHSQRHQFVIDFVKRNKPQKVVDLGCCECTLLKKLKFHRGFIELLVGVDVNGGKIKKKMYGLAPISADFLQPSYDQLRIELYQGSVTQKDVRLRGFDLVTSIELIEHLTLADVERFSEVVFGYMTPVAVIVSTPNSEFNNVLPGLTGFRNSDHKFEWTRAEFQSWALKVCLDYGYEVEFTGVGPAPPGQQEMVGFCSQIGVFHRLGGFYNNLMSFYLLLYQLYSVTYPSLRDNNILRRVLVSEVLFWAAELKRKFIEKMTADGDDAVYQIIVLLTSRCAVRCVSVPLAVLWTCSPKVSNLSGCLSNLRHFLMEDPEVKLSQDGSAVLLQDPDLEEGDVDLEDSGYVEASHYSHIAEEKEDWETDV
uniref:Small RNA 2'-O-methyltransferase n=1 Tax=Mola mola TaxID=94237 RepID=A0A3Q3VL29_MOLML